MCPASAMKCVKCCCRTLVFALASVALFAAYNGRDTNVVTLSIQQDSIAAKIGNTKPIEQATPQNSTQALALERVKAKLQPIQLKAQKQNDDGVIPKHQFLHLHHMKTAGTSMDGLVQCSLQRFQEVHDVRMPYQNLHECSHSHYKNCVSGQDQSCLSRTRQSSVLSYCAPLRDLDMFRWKSAKAAVTVLRHPVDRVWSMFRFQTKSCYGCQPLIEILRDIEAGNSTLDAMCRDQLVNHQTTNLLSATDDLDIKTSNVNDLVDNAVENMQSFFTLIGLTEEMPATTKMVQHVFPWMAETIPGSDQNCTLEHRNSSPKNNRCGADGGHWNLRPHPDKETRQAIIRVNRIDMKVYRKAVELFELQRQALNL